LVTMVTRNRASVAMVTPLEAERALRTVISYVQADSTLTDEYTQVIYSLKFIILRILTNATCKITQEK
jgi:hypothetical protein